MMDPQMLALSVLVIVVLVITLGEDALGLLILASALGLVVCGVWWVWMLPIAVVGKWAITCAIVFAASALAGWSVS